MLKNNPFNRLFFKLLLGFWLCSSLIIALVSLLPLLQQNHDRSKLPPSLERVLQNVAERIQQQPQLLESNNLQRLQRGRDRNGGPIRLYLTDDEGKVLNNKRVSREFRRFQLMAEEANQPISHQFRDELIFGPYAFDVNGKNYLLFGRLPDNHPRPWFFFFADNKLLTAGLAILLSGFLCGLLAWYLGKPLRSLKLSANALAKGDLANRVDAATASRRDEMGQLAVAFNGMADAIETMVNNQQRLMGDISHELRTPLTRLQLSLALARKKGQHSTELDRIEYEALQQEALISELLTLSRVRLNATEKRLTAELTETLSQVLDDAEFEAEQQRKLLHINIDESICFEHLPKTLSRAIENLLRNAIRYAEKNIYIESHQTKHRVSIVVKDDGPGLAEEELEAIFTPFYRPDSSRDRESGGWGLGLAITQAAINAHGGQIAATNQQPHGLVVTINLPTELSTL
ncbi:ATP-binding protein [Shewanella ulleungensis]|jgi:two-component system sensor histidine kinase CpxA|uniref:ATP-binding protein n=1 Tax=Shewanella ulleungensis TaxID=2282699 RepID=UPI0016637F50|nr:ATP-binding protein [Shewanella ulleungensis]MCL1150785.1 ATP-binding protein [Shewanella ulleungensis]